MGSDAGWDAQAYRADPIVVRVQHALGGRWEVVLPDRRRGITCETLDEARRIAYLAVTRVRPCELIVRDAYHRVAHREVINARENRPTTAQPPSPDPATGPDREAASPRARQETSARPAGTRAGRHRRRR